MATGTRANTGREARAAALATTRKAPVVRTDGATRPMLLGRFVLGVTLIGLAFLLVPRLELGAAWRWSLGILAFVAGNLIRPLHRDPVRRRDQGFATAIEIVHFLLLCIGLIAIALILRQFPTDTVLRALLHWQVLGCATAFFALVGLRDLMYRWRR